MVETEDSGMKRQVYVIEERDWLTLKWEYVYDTFPSRAEGREALSGRRQYLAAVFQWPIRKARLMTRLAVYEYARPA